MRSLLLLLCFSAFAVGGTSSALAECTRSDEKYKIGVILPLTGPQSSIGHLIRNGILLAQKKQSEKGVSGIDLIFEDDQLEKAKSVSAFHKLVNSDHVCAVFAFGSGIGNALGPLAERQKIVLIAIAASDKGVAAGKKYVFTHWASPETMAKELVREIRKRGYKRIAMISNEQEGVIAFNEAFTAELRRVGLWERVLLRESYLMDVLDFNLFIAKAKAKNIDGVYIAMFPASLVALVKQTHALGFAGELFGVEMFEDQHTVKATDGLLVGKWYVNTDEPQSDFSGYYRDEYGEVPGYAAANGYDSLDLVAKALKKHGPDNEKIAQFLHTLHNHSGAAGIYSATGDNRFTLPAAVKIVTKEGFEKKY